MASYFSYRLQASTPGEANGAGASGEANGAAAPAVDPKARQKGR